MTAFALGLTSFSSLSAGGSALREALTAGDGLRCCIILFRRWRCEQTGTVSLRLYNMAKRSSASSTDLKPKSCTEAEMSAMKHLRVGCK